MKIGNIDNLQAVPAELAVRDKMKVLVQHRAARQDSVEISEDARRQLADRADARLKEPEVSGPDAATYKLEQIKQKVEAGYYDIPEVHQKIAHLLSDVVMLQIETVRPEKL